MALLASSSRITEIDMDSSNGGDQDCSVWILPENTTIDPLGRCTGIPVGKETNEKHSGIRLVLSI